jgi:hypothetical protein
LLSYSMIREQLNVQPTKTTKAHSTLVVKHISLAKNGNHCNGTIAYPGCGLSPLPVGNIIIVEESGSYWCLSCAAKHNLQAGMHMVGNKHFSEASWAFPASKTKKAPPKATTIECANIDAIRTQKARGMAVITTVGRMYTPPTVLIQSTTDLAKVEKVLQVFHEAGEKTWARPCPTRPRHGFLESRKVDTVDQVKELWEKTKALEDDAELMLQPMVNATMSGIITPNKLVWGPGNDGATSGRDTLSL